MPALRAEAFCLVKIPHTSAKRIYHAVAEQDADGIFARVQVGENVVCIIVAILVGITDIGGKMAFRDLLPVCEKTVKSQTADIDARLTWRKVERERATKMRCGDVGGKATRSVGCANESLFQHIFSAFSVRANCTENAPSFA